jgi:elongation factor G
VTLEILPLEQGSGIIINNRLIGGAIPKEFIPSIKEGIVQAADNGPTGGYPVVDIEVNLIDGSYHPVDSSGPAFRAAGSIAFRAAVKKANPILLEPMMKMEVVIPGEFLGAVLGDLSGRRAQIKSMEGGDSSQQVTALVPLAEIFGYTTTLRSMTQGRSSHSMEFQFYERVPKNLYNGIMVGG